MRGPSEVCGACGDHSRVAARENQVWEVLIWAMETRKQAGMLGALLNVASLLGYRLGREGFYKDLHQDGIFSSKMKNANE